MGSSAKKKREKKKDFQKAKLKVGTSRPKNTNATDTNFSAKSIVLKQQNLGESNRDAPLLFEHNLSLLDSKNETQRRDALTFLTSAIATSDGPLPQPVSTILAKVQPLILDGSLSVRTQLLKLLKRLSGYDLGAVDQALLYTRAGMTHLSDDIRTTSLDVLEWLLGTDGTAVTGCAGGWVKTLRTLQNLLAWHGSDASTLSSSTTTWAATTARKGKLFIRHIIVLAHFLTVGLTQEQLDADDDRRRAAAAFPLWSTDTHLLPSKRDPFGYMNLFGAVRDVESEIYDDAGVRAEVLVDSGMYAAFEKGIHMARREGGEVGRAAALADKALKLADRHD